MPAIHPKVMKKYAKKNKAQIIEMVCDKEEGPTEPINQVFDQIIEIITKKPKKSLWRRILEFFRIKKSN